MTGEKVEFARAAARDAEELAAGMRAADRAEAALWAGLSPREAASRSVALADAAFSARLGGGLLCVFGASLLSLVEREALVWMLCTGLPERRPRAFLSACRDGFRLLAAAVPEARTFTNHAWSGNAAALRWLSWCGAWITVDPPERGFLGGEFVRFRIDAADAAERGL